MRMYLLLLALCTATTASDCKSLEITATEITYQVDTPADINEKLCSELYTPPRCPGSKEVVSSPVLVKNSDGGVVDEGWYNIADSYSALTSPERLVRIGHGSFVFPEVGSLYLQSYQDCNANQTECYTRIAITGGDGIYDCASGTVDYKGKNADEEIVYDTNFCLACGGSSSGTSSMSLGLTALVSTAAAAAALSSIIF
eukprot:CAMPEP_0197719816 /NCGR_PEP_ID=MMETSP1434-20131217/3413_1 /TAXON_ID=265543 /ORGANISM="Minutocellus polymorphus, Strain CCMP3303" /LENGTH=198 /DNA_ID=CAMNT_0043304595 /DNA_START=198 /DNA_END=794 /DNA_ORIENTATION=+